MHVVKSTKTSITFSAGTYTISQNKLAKREYVLTIERKTYCFTRLRIGHSGLNNSLFTIGKHQSGLCDTCSEAETIEHVLLHCAVYTKEREELFKKL